MVNACTAKEEGTTIALAERDRSVGIQTDAENDMTQEVPETP